MIVKTDCETDESFYSTGYGPAKCNTQRAAGPCHQIFPGHESVSSKKQLYWTQFTSYQNCLFQGGMLFSFYPPTPPTDKIFDELKWKTKAQEAKVSTARPLATTILPRTFKKLRKTLRVIVSTSLLPCSLLLLRKMYRKFHPNFLCIWAKCCMLANQTDRMSLFLVTSSSCTGHSSCTRSMKF